MLLFHWDYLQIHISWPCELFFLVAHSNSIPHSRCQKPPNIRRDTENSIILFKLCFAVKLKMIKNGGRTTFLMEFIHIYHHYFLFILYWFLDRQMLSFLLPNKTLVYKTTIPQTLVCFSFRFVLQFNSFLSYFTNKTVILWFVFWFISFLILHIFEYREILLLFYIWFQLWSKHTLWTFTTELWWRSTITANSRYENKCCC